MAAAERIPLEVAYARPDRQQVISLQVVTGSTLEQAIRQSRILEQFPEIDLANARVGIFGKLQTLNTVLRAGDRVEIYRPLLADPKQVRQQRAAASGKPARGGTAGGHG